MLSTKTKYRSPEASAFYTAGLILLGIVVTAFLVSLFWTPYSPDATDAAAKLIAPCAEHPFGTDNFGRDVLSRVMSASKYTIYISAAGVAIALILGTFAGIPAGYFGGYIDKGIMLLGNSSITVSVAATVSVSIVFIVMFAKVVGSFLPIAAEKIGVDPAVMANPLISTLTDAVSLLIYIFVAKLVLKI